MAQVVFSSELQRYTGGETETTVSATSYRELLEELVNRYEDLESEELMKMAVAIDGEIIHDPLLESVG
ncbi:MAG: MoaD/ThiS family protein, partial [Pseudomonadales bacterium]